ncbi:hypothetical protein PBY51_009047 [Eleginops maclovinus]|uniref:Uncharacterized protein n=1 Tax=Eleginops maclovinus TaxID=56733 RepID=A0AAN8ABY6_ELEMC|nr:hypothetical protein PBY51_009047 [Eleginops maclovinus]
MVGRLREQRVHPSSGLTLKCSRGFAAAGGARGASGGSALKEPPLVRTVSQGLPAGEAFWIPSKPCLYRYYQSGFTKAESLYE